MGCLVDVRIRIPDGFLPLKIVYQGLGRVLLCSVGEIGARIALKCVFIFSGIGLSENRPDCICRWGQTAIYWRRVGEWWLFDGQGGKF